MKKKAVLKTLVLDPVRDSDLVRYIEGVERGGGNVAALLRDALRAFVQEAQVTNATILRELEQIKDQLQFRLPGAVGAFQINEPADIADALDRLGE